jgi:rubrerythrin
MNLEERKKLMEERDQWFFKWKCPECGTEFQGGFCVRCPKCGQSKTLTLLDMEKKE